MKKIISIMLILLVGLTIFSGCSSNKIQENNLDLNSNQNNQVIENLSEKEQAKEFSLKIVKTYFDNDCNQYVSYLDDKIYDLMNNEKLLLSKEQLKVIDENSCFLKDIVNNGYSFQDYLNSYEIIIMDKNEYQLKHPGSKLLNSFNSENSYLFIGLELKDKNSEDFISTGYFRFIVKKENGIWKLTHLSI